MLWLRRLGSLKLSVVLLAMLFATVLGGTLAQAVWGAGAIQSTLLGRVVFLAGGWWWPGLPLLLAVTGVNLCVGAWCHLERSVHHLGLWGLHAALVLFCFGSLGFSLAQQDLVLGLVPGASSSKAFVRDAAGDETRPLPFLLTVNAFRVETYPGSVEPSDYVSTVTVTSSTGDRSAEIRMNQPLREDGWTIYQSSVQAVDGRDAPVFKLMFNPWAPFPTVVSLLAAVSLALHFAVRRRSSRRG
jgi:hypothetical protein